MSGYLGDQPQVEPTDWTAGILPGTTQNVNPSAAGVAGSAGTALGVGTGRFGFQNVAGNAMGNNPFTAAWHWLNEPFTTPLSTTEIFLLVGIVLIAILMWNLILYHIRIAAEAI